ncbi:4-amino-4-deoxy-L-arabinose-phosphoundecaprenol flippase subunit ArnF [Tatumella terrea]|uniref:Probable 4-amino-4-deoxy-L-arabinose-phosphoundecaprenol flippase subunit ArnF n=1 Tax=Tatumella terrea TaxID=419007 RepID=A0ABW1VY56_9GAMM
MMGYFWALLSVLLVSGAQPAMKEAMTALPASGELISLLVFLWHHPMTSGLLLAGLLGYALSMGCWFLALKRLALSKAYALLSLSYILVWGIALGLGLHGEHFSVSALAGILLVITGVILVCLPSKPPR